MRELHTATALSLLVISGALGVAGCRSSPLVGRGTSDLRASADTSGLFSAASALSLLRGARPFLGDSPLPEALLRLSTLSPCAAAALSMILADQGVRSEGAVVEALTLVACDPLENDEYLLGLVVSGSGGVRVRWEGRVTCVGASPTYEQVSSSAVRR